MYRTPYSPAHAAGPSLQMNAPLDIILIKVQSIFSSFACSSISKGFFISLFCLYSLLQPPVVSALQIETGDFKDKSFGVRCRWLYTEAERWKCKVHFFDQLARLGECRSRNINPAVWQLWMIPNDLLIMTGFCLYSGCTGTNMKTRQTRSHCSRLLGLLVGECGCQQERLAVFQGMKVRSEVTFAWVIAQMGSLAHSVTSIHTHIFIWARTVGGDC